MNQILTKLRQHFPFLHKRAATEDDFFDFCERNEIEVVTTNLISKGVYVIFQGKHFIFLNNELKGRMLLYVMFHELAHYLFHFPSQSRYGVEFFSVHSKEKNHTEAEYAAALLLYPSRDLHEVFCDTEFSATPELQYLMGLRLEIASRYRI